VNHVESDAEKKASQDALLSSLGESFRAGKIYAAKPCYGGEEFICMICGARLSQGLKSHLIAKNHAKKDWMRSPEEQQTGYINAAQCMVHWMGEFKVPVTDLLLTGEQTILRGGWR
jgi:hypothetical protein